MGDAHQARHSYVPQSQTHDEAMSQPTALLGAPTAQPWRYSRESCTASQGRSVWQTASRKVSPMALNSASWRKDKGSSSERGYTWAWTKARRVYLNAHPLCVMCSAAKRVTVAEVVDHIIPHQGNQELFWDEANWQPLCKRHHDTDKAEQEGRHAARAKFGDDGRVVW